jgi:VRR-NUC domain
MSTTPEGKVKAIIKEKLKAVPNLYYFMPPANGFGRAGIPDFVGCLPNGRMFAIETKAGKGIVTALQQRELDKLARAGGVALVIRGEYEATMLDLTKL